MIINTFTAAAARLSKQTTKSMSFSFLCLSYSSMIASHFLQSLAVQDLTDRGDDGIGRSSYGERGSKYAEAVKRPSQGMYRDGRWCIFGVIPYLTAIGGRDAVQYSRKRDD